MEEIGRTGWLMLGVTGMAAAGVVHAVAGAARIATDVVHAPKAAALPASGTQAEDGVSEAGGWVLLGFVLLAAGGLRHVVAAAWDLGRQILGRPQPA